MVLLLALLVSHWGLFGAAAGHMELERIKTCSTKCSQGLQCKTKPDYLFPPPCQQPAEGLTKSSVFHNISLSTVMSCAGKQRCSLHLRIKTVLQLSDSIHGLSICTVTPGMLANCRIFTFSKASRQKMSGLQVEVENDCTDVSSKQHVQVMVKTLPSYCGITWTGTYNTPDCDREDLRRHVPECITGRLSYAVNPEKKELSVSVADMLEDHNYHLRLCHKDFICSATEAIVLLKKEEPIKSAILPYSRPLPCLCIEGWSSVTDAPRIQVCPFKDNLEELWHGITFDPLEEALSWEPACPVSAVVALCQRGEGDVCVDLPHPAKNVSREKITFNKVDPHPQLCMKFTAGHQSWIRCPFVGGRFQAWQLALTKRQGHVEVMMLSQITATFLVGLCVKSAGSPVCHTAETRTVHVWEHKSFGLNLLGESCTVSACLHIKRLNVTYAATVVRCFERCTQSSWDLTVFIVPACLCLTAIIIVTLVLHALLSVYQRRKQKRNPEYCPSEKETLSTLRSVVALQSQPALCG